MPELTVTAPEGSHFAFEEVKTAKGAESLGQVPILVWDSVNAAIANFGEEGITDILDGTSLRVSYQGIARRLKAAGKTDDEIATAQAAFKPGKRAGGVSTPVSRAAKAAKSAAEKVDGDLVSALLEKIAKGELSAADIQSLTA
jgi:anti-sigma28 factor (negative regulator of flagellin synthesis)